MNNLHSNDSRQEGNCSDQQQAMNWEQGYLELTSTLSPSLTELRQRHPQLRFVERTGDSDEDNRQRYLTQIAFNRLFLSAIPTALIVAACAIAAYHYASGPADASPKFYLVRNVASIIWGAWAIYWIIEGWFSGYCLVPRVINAIEGTKYDPARWLIPPRYAYPLAVTMLILAWILLFLAPYHSELPSSYSINVSDGEFSNSTKIVVFLSIMFVGTCAFVVGMMAYLRYRLRDSRR